MKNERRQKTRVDFKTRVRVKTPHGNISAESDSRDISFKGLFVFTDKEIRPFAPQKDIQDDFN
jgi:hypothetical protein